ncbi:transposase [Paenibacillus apiarius]|uniref:Transposase n=1 Tax=Paenibacillus apiarius TaxID=46240 RepID=A0ABT4DYA6_9BACL|nr:transposase [Paenibacillus apiarius]MCY9517812.1 transposase [Paenibacillus apiarius]MCY9522334.1 transposase [Paenibacillus apiarius]MCY9555113.1 transposase [Paenibacillus apiarius]MCY9558197.1 transposase [Paenibacillus apiarius]MCY9684597.1 transposase [Paenibacillus apiarius]
MLGDSEYEEAWRAFFQELKQRGLRGVDYTVSDQLGGLVRAIRQHFIRNSGCPRFGNGSSVGRKDIRNI